MSYPFVCKQVSFSFTTSDKHTQELTSLKIVWLWMQIRKRSEEENTHSFCFHSHIQHSCLLGNEGQQSWAWETVCLFSVLHAREQVNTLNLDERRRKEGSAAFCLSLCWTTEKSSWCRSVPGLSMWPIHPSSRAVQMFVPKHLLPHRMYFFRVCVQCYEEFSSDRK